MERNLRPRKCLKTSALVHAKICFTRYRDSTQDWGKDFSHLFSLGIWFGGKYCAQSSADRPIYLTQVGPTCWGTRTVMARQSSGPPALILLGVLVSLATAPKRATYRCQLIEPAILVSKSSKRDEWPHEAVPTTDGIHLSQVNRPIR